MFWPELGIGPELGLGWPRHVGSSVAFGEAIKIISRQTDGRSNYTFKGNWLGNWLQIECGATLLSSVVVDSGKRREEERRGKEEQR